MKANVNAITFNHILEKLLLSILCQQFGEGSFLCLHAQSDFLKDMVRCEALVLTPVSTFGMNWNVDCEPGLLMPVLELTIALLIEQTHIPHRDSTMM